MKEIILSLDLKEIEFEIFQHQKSASNSIIEIGKRLNHVKEKNLVHGEFMTWVENSLKMSYQTANKYMRVAKEFPNISHARTISLENLYLISTLPNKEKNDEINKIEDGNPSTRKEIQSLKKQISELSQSHQRQLREKDEVINKSYELIKDLQEQGTKTVEVEVVPKDYDATKEQNEHLKGQYKTLNDSYESIKKQYDELLDSRKEVEEKSMKYDEITQAIQKAESKLNAQQKEIAAYRNLIDTTKEMNKFLDAASHLIYMDDMDILNQDKLAIDELERLLSRVDSWAIDLRKKLNTKVIIEGEFTHE